MKKSQALALVGTLEAAFDAMPESKRTIYVSLLQRYSWADGQAGVQAVIEGWDGMYRWPRLRVVKDAVVQAMRDRERAESRALPPPKDPVDPEQVVVLIEGYRARMAERTPELEAREERPAPEWEEDPEEFELRKKSVLHQFDVQFGTKPPEKRQEGEG